MVPQEGIPLSLKTFHKPQETPAKIHNEIDLKHKVEKNITQLHSTNARNSLKGGKYFEKISMGKVFHFMRLTHNNPHSEPWHLFGFLLPCLEILNNF